MATFPHNLETGVLSYGASLWNVESTGINQFYITSRKSVRKILGVPYQTHSYLLPWLAGCLAMDTQIMLRSMNFVLRGLQSRNNVTNRFLSLKGSNSSIFKSVQQCIICINSIYVMMYSPNVMEHNHAADICDDLVTTVHNICQILDQDIPRVFSRTEVDILLYYLCN